MNLRKFSSLEGNMDQSTGKHKHEQTYGIVIFTSILLKIFSSSCYLQLTGCNLRPYITATLWSMLVTELLNEFY